MCGLRLQDTTLMQIHTYSPAGCSIMKQGFTPKFQGAIIYIARFV